MIFFYEWFCTFARNKELGDELSLTAFVGKSLLKRLIRIFPFERMSKNEMSVLSSRKMSVWRTSPSHFLAFCSSSWTTSLTWSSDKKSLIFVLFWCVWGVLCYFRFFVIFCDFLVIFCCWLPETPCSLPFLFCFFVCAFKVFVFLFLCFVLFFSLNF